jgi:hypothetical protein
MHWFHYLISYIVKLIIAQRCFINITHSTSYLFISHHHAIVAHSTHFNPSIFTIHCISTHRLRRCQHSPSVPISHNKIANDHTSLLLEYKLSFIASTDNHRSGTFCMQEMKMESNKYLFGGMRGDANLLVSRVDINSVS